MGGIGLPRRMTGRDDGSEIVNLESRIAELEDELRETQARLRDREGMLHALSEHANDLTYILDRDTRFTYVSPSICNLTEYEAEEIMAADPGGIFHVDALPIILTAI